MAEFYHHYVVYDINLKEFSAHTPSNSKELFNYNHFSLHTVECVWSFEISFQNLDIEFFFLVETQVDIVIA